MSFIFFAHVISLSCSSTRSFDSVLHGVLKKAKSLGSVRAAVEAELQSLDEHFIPTLGARIDEAPTDELWAVMNAIGDIYDNDDLRKPMAIDEIILRHWSPFDGDIADDGEALAVDMDFVGRQMDGVPETASRPHVSERPSAYGEVTRSGGRTLFSAMGLSPTASALAARRRGPAVCVQDGHVDGVDQVGFDRYVAPAPRGAAVFVDLGSGAGRLVAQAWLELAPSGVIGDAIGVELAPSRHFAATRAWASLCASADAPPDHASRAPQFILGSLLDADLTSATHVYVSSLCFPDWLLDACWERLCARDVAPRLEVVASLRPFRGVKARAALTGVVEVAMNWNSACKVCLYQLGN